MGVVFNRPIEQVFTYHVPIRLSRIIQAGQRVRVPLGRGDRSTVGYCVWVDPQPPGDIEPSRIKEVVEVLDPLPLIDRKMLELTRWMANYYACSWGQALDAVVPAGVKKHAGTRIGTFLVVPEETREALRDAAKKPPLTPKQSAVLDVLCRADEPLTTADVRRLAKCTDVPIQSLKKQGLLHTVKKRLPVGLPGSADSSSEPVPANGGSPKGDAKTTVDRPRLILTADQSATLERLAPALESGRFAPFLIHGVTGSGKTEVYLAAIDQVVGGREAIVLVPEISLTPQTIRRFRRRFSRVAVLHSHMSDADATAIGRASPRAKSRLSSAPGRRSSRRRDGWG